MQFLDMRLVALGMAALAAAAPARAETVVISTAGYDLASDAGMARLSRHVARAADQVCGTVDGRNLALARSHRACVAGATADAMGQLDEARRLARRAEAVTVASR